MNSSQITSDPWIHHMRSGAFEKAWKFSDNILKQGLNRDYDNLPRHYQCIWDGTPLNGKRVLIRCYHGLGDTIQFIRYAALVKEIAKEVIVWTQKPLIKLLETVKGIDQLLPLHDGSPEVDYDVDVEIMELPHIFRTTVSTIPAEIPYLHVEPMQLPQKKHLAIGLVWQVSNWNQSRNIPYSVFENLKEVEHSIYILQENASSAGWKEGFGTHPGEFDLYNYARLIKGLDLLITVDSMPAHVAGAQNVPVWVMLTHEADWRWMKNRIDCPWYPSMRLFRQQTPGDWKSVVESISKEIKNNLAANT